MGIEGHRVVTGLPKEPFTLGKKLTKQGVSQSFIVCMELSRRMSKQGC